MLQKYKLFARGRSSQKTILLEICGQAELRESCSFAILPRIQARARESGQKLALEFFGEEERLINFVSRNLSDVDPS